MEVAQTHFIIDWINYEEVSRLKNNFKPQMDAGHQWFNVFFYGHTAYEIEDKMHKKVDRQFN